MSSGSSNAAGIASFYSNTIGAGVGPDQKWFLRSRKILAALVMLAPVFGLEADSVGALQVVGDKGIEFAGGLILLWSILRPDGARPRLLPRLDGLKRALASLGIVFLLLPGCALTITKTDDVTSATWVAGAAQVSAGQECTEGQECRGVEISGAHASEGFLAAVLSPLATILKGLLAGL